MTLQTRTGTSSEPVPLDNVRVSCSMEKHHVPARIPAKDNVSVSQLLDREQKLSALIMWLKKQ